jgi:hypothetical protein
MLIIGDNGLSVDEQKMQMAIWAVVAVCTSMRRCDVAGVLLRHVT